jgi:hypothetical protein
MATSGSSGYPAPGTGGVGAQVNAARLWAGGFATAIVASLAAVLALEVGGVVDLVAPDVPAPVSGGSTSDFVVDAFLASLLATGLMHLLALTTPRPRTFFGWILGLVTAILAVVGFAGSDELDVQVFTAATVVLVGIVIGSLLSAVASRAVYFEDDTTPYA